MFYSSRKVGELTMTKIPATSSTTPGMKYRRPRLRTNALLTADLHRIQRM